MVFGLGAVSPELTNPPQQDDFDTASTSLEEYPGEDTGAVVQFDGASAPNFGNLAITNSSDVHIGNKTYYQGPVTIKQILYTNGTENGQTIANGVPVTEKKTKEGDEGDVVLDGLFANASEKKDAGSTEVLTEDVKGLNCLSNFSRRQIYVITSFTALVLMSLLILLTVLLSRHNPTLTGQNSGWTDSDEQQSVNPAEPPLDPSTNITFPNKVRIVSRIEWVAQPPISGVNPISVSPVPYVIIQHTATENCSFQAQCVLNVRSIQMFHVESRNWSDIGYNFLVGGDGNAYEGRGWGKEGAHTLGYNSRSLGIAFIGTFQAIKAPVQQLMACKYLIDKGVSLGYIAKDYKLFGARQLQSSQSPGDKLYEEIVKWSHWASKP